MEKKTLPQPVEEIKITTKDNSIHVYCPSSHKIATDLLVNLRELLNLAFDGEEIKKCWYVFPNNKAITNMLASLKTIPKQQQENFVITKDQYLNILDRLNKLEYPSKTK